MLGRRWGVLLAGNARRLGGNTRPVCAERSPLPHLAIRRSQSAPHMHVLGGICNNVRQFFHKGRSHEIAMILPHLIGQCP